MRQRIATIGFLVVLLFAMDQLYRIAYPEVNLLRGTLVGATAWASLRGLELLGARAVPARLGGSAVFLSAFGSVLAIEAGWLVSRSATSAVVHVVLLAVSVPFLERLLPIGQRQREARTARISSSGASPGSSASASRVADATRTVAR